MGKVIKFQNKKLKPIENEPEWRRKLRMVQEALDEFAEDSECTEKRRALREEVEKERAEAAKKKEVSRPGLYI